MAIAIIVTHPHYDLCGEITHWDRTEIVRFDDVNDFIDTYGAEEEELRSLYETIQQHGSYQRYTGQPYFPVWLGKYGGMRATPETSPTADLVWVEERGEKT